MKRELTERPPLQGNGCFSNTSDVGAINSFLDFLPTFGNRKSVDVYLSLFVGRRRAPVHLLEGLPDGVVTHRKANGTTRVIQISVISGFVR